MSGAGTFDSQSTSQQEEDVSSEEGIGTDAGGPSDSVEEEATETNTANAAGAVSDLLKISSVSDLDSLYGLRELGRQALCWKLSSAKPGNGVEQIRDQNPESYWQSDGQAQPHWIQVSFQRRVAISHICLYLDFSLDESYTPKNVLIEAGMTSQDLQPAQLEVEFNEPSGWCVIPVHAPPDPLDLAECPDQPVRAHLVRISVLGMHQNGRDTHVRQVHLYGPRTKSASGAATLPTAPPEPRSEMMAADEDAFDLGPLSTDVLIR